MARRKHLERIEAAVETGGKHVAAPSEAWIAADPRRGDVRVLLTGPHGFERTVRFAADEEPAVITERVRATLDETPRSITQPQFFRLRGLCRYG